MTRHYLDHNATAPLRPEVIDTIADAMREGGNASSIHSDGRRAHKRVEDAREKLRSLINAPANGIIFTSGGTEAIHLAIASAVAAHKVERIFVSAIEHPAVLANAEASSAPVETLPVLPSGVVDLDALRDRIAAFKAAGGGAFLLCLMAANNETGVIQPIAEAAAIAHEHDGLVFIDAAQAIGKIPLNFVMSGADLMAVTAHKMGGPVGVGALIAGPNLPLAPVFHGGGQEMNRRAGTSNTPAIAGFGTACELARDTLARGGDIAALRDDIEEAVVSAGATIWGATADRLPGTLCLSAPGFSGETQLMAMDLAGLSVSVGSACSSGKVKQSHVLSAMGASEEEAGSSIRVSLGWNSTREDADAFIAAWPSAYARIKEKAA